MGYRDFRDEEEYRRWHQYGHERGWMERAGDQVRSWFGDHDAESRRDMDKMRGMGQRGQRDLQYDDHPEAGAEQFRRDSMGTHNRGAGREGIYRDQRGLDNIRHADTGRGEYGRDNYMYGSQAQRHDGPINRWTLGDTEFSEFGTKAADDLNRGGRGTHYGRGPRNYQRSDERIREDIIERLIRHHDVDGSDIEVEVLKGDVTLKGLVETRYEKRLAEDIVDDIFGVKNVQNQLRVRQLMGLNEGNRLPADGAKLPVEGAKLPGEDTNPRTTGGIMGTTPGTNSR